MRRTRGFDVTSLPYRARVYINNQVLLPASLVRALEIRDHAYVRITFVFKGKSITLGRVKLLRTRNTDSRQFTIPKAVRVSAGVEPGDIVEIVDVEPLE